MAIENFGNKINTNGFDKNPENINKDGRPISVREDLKRILSGAGTIKIKARDVVSTDSNGDVTITAPQSFLLADQLLKWALSRKGNESLKAIQMIMEQVDGKPKQSIDQSNQHTFTNGFKITDLYKTQE